MRTGTFSRAVSAAVALVAVVALATAGSGTATGSLPTIYVVYAMNCTFTIQNDSGQVISSIPPGLYQVDVRTPVPFGTVQLANLNITDMTACKGFPQFQLSGPGVNLFTTMTAGCQSDQLFPETFQPSASYTAVDNNQPTVARATFSTTATGTPPPSTVPSTWNGKTQQSTDYLGGGTGSLAGTLTGTLDSKGVPTLLSHGKPVKTLAPGRYRFSITDKDAKASFMLLGPKASTTLNVTGVKFVGKHTMTVRLTTGRWIFSSGLMAQHYFRVAS
jgi:hypothetical protein